MDGRIYRVIITTFLPPPPPYRSNVSPHPPPPLPCLQVKFYADGGASFTKAAGLEFSTGDFGGVRLQRMSALVRTCGRKGGRKKGRRRGQGPECNAHTPFTNQPTPTAAAHQSPIITGGGRRREEAAPGGRRRALHLGRRDAARGALRDAPPTSLLFAHWTHDKTRKENRANYVMIRGKGRS